MKAVFLGPPGAGKSTLAGYFSRKYCIPYISTGDLFRAEISRNTELGRIAKQYIDKGELVPDDIVIELVKRELKKIDRSRGFILDGYPRTLKQAEALEEIAPIDVAIYVYIPVEIAIDRLATRYICPVCGRIYNLKYYPPKNDLQCDFDGIKLVRRSDDDPDVIRYRYKIYQEQTAPVVEYYRRINKLIEVDNSGSSDETIKLLEKILLERGLLKLEPCSERVYT